MTDTTLLHVLELIAEIFQLCLNHPDLNEVAHRGLAQIVAELPPPIQPKTRVEKAIRDHITQQAKQNSRHLSFPPRNDLRMWAERLAKRHSLQFNPKEVKKKKQVIEWLSQHWETVEDGFFTMLDHPRMREKKRS
jgi:hypothetical protein